MFGANRGSASSELDRPHPRWARFYARVAEQAERKGAWRFRERLVAGIAGRVLEVGAGPGLNFRYYGPHVTRVEAVEPEPSLRALAERRAEAAQVEVCVHAGRGEQLPFGASEFDAAVLCYLLCTVDDPAAILAELRRCVRPGGELRFWEHVRSPGRGLAVVQDTVDVLFWPRLGAGCHTGRDSLSAIEAAGFQISCVERFFFAHPWLAFAAGPQLLGSARR